MEEGVTESRINDVRGVTTKHLGHILIENLLIDLLIVSRKWWKLVWHPSEWFEYCEGYTCQAGGGERCP